MQVIRLFPDCSEWNKTIDFAENCSWIAGKHFAMILRENRLTDWEAAFAAVEGDEIIGYCTFLKEDYYPENRYSPWISSLFVDEDFRGNRVSQKLIQKAEEYAKNCGFERVYIPSDMINFYEKYGYRKIDSLINYGGDMDDIFTKEL